MSDIAIEANGLSKRYKIGALKQRQDTLRDEIVHGFKSMFSAFGRKGTRSSSNEELWAIKDVTFEVERGQVLGIIGRNGAGKSTLLKVLSRITEPTTGLCNIYGRVGSLLEVGTGFHGELTGRENVYLNGAILGMTKSEIDRNFDEIVAFSEVERFIDTPVKRYSSGMQVRLAFAVAAHLEPEILIIDEVLAVGDMAFQAKCIGKLGAVAQQGRTVLFVSHNIGAVTNLCTTGLLIEHGTVKMQSDVKSVVDYYIKSQPQLKQDATSNWKRKGTGAVNILGARLMDAKGDDCEAFMMGETLALEFDVEFLQSFASVNVQVEISRKELGMRVLQIQNGDAGFMVEQVRPGVRRFRVEIPNCMLYPTSYEFALCVWEHARTLALVEGALEFSIIQSAVTRRTSALTMNSEAIYYQPSVWKDVAVDPATAGIAPAMSRS